MDTNEQMDVVEGGDHAPSAPRESNGRTNNNGGFGGESCHILMIPGASQAHIVTCFRLAKELVNREGVVITFVTQRKQIARLESVYSPGELQKLGIIFQALDDDSTFKSLNDASNGIQTAIQPLREKWMAEKKAGVFKPNCIVADRFFHWTQDLCEELQLPRYIYNSNSAVFLRYLQASAELMPILREALKRPDWLTRTHAELRKQKSLEFMHEVDIPILFSPCSFIPEFTVKVWENCESSDGIIINTASRMEAAVIDSIQEALRSRTPHGKVPRLYSVGPITNVANFKNETFTAATDDGSSTECIDWLNTQPDKSVLYVCLGSQTYLSRPQILQLALGLEATQQRFLWGLLSSEDDSTTLEEVLPPGFLQRVAGRGKVWNGWVAQVSVISHRSTFGFLSHCGWQSIFESLTYGVPILGWPRQNEQHLNCRYITEVLKVGLRVNEKPGNEMTVKEEFETAILRFMVEVDGRVVSDAAHQIKLLLAAAVAKGGSSYHNREELIKSMRKA